MKILGFSPVWLILIVIFFILLLPIKESCPYAPYVLHSKTIEGLILANSAKVTVVKNAANGLALTSGWIAPNATKIVSTKPIPNETDRKTNTHSGITINPNNGIITITYTDTIAKNSPTLLLIPKANGKLLQAGEATGHSVISWECHADSAPEQDVFQQMLGTVSSHHVPTVCRSQQLQQTIKNFIAYFIAALKCTFK